MNEHYENKMEYKVSSTVPSGGFAQLGGNMKEFNDAVAKTASILDSGARRKFDTGAVRDISEGKGRCDLLPLDMVGRFFPSYEHIFALIDSYVRNGKISNIQSAIEAFCVVTNNNIVSMMLEVSMHYEAGMQKYGARNWEQGIPCYCYIDSGVRHLLKYMMGMDDEPHHRAFVWNMLCLMWTHEHLPKMWELPFNEVKKTQRD